MANRIAGLSVAAVVAAAGFSRRMGRFKQLLPWGENSTVIAAVVQNLAHAGTQPVLCVVGHRRQEVRAALQATGAWIVYNPQYRLGETLSSYQVGVQALLGQEGLPGRGDWCGSLLSLGDQPHVSTCVIEQLLAQCQVTPDRIVIPSHNRRRGHPIYLPARLWTELLALGENENLRHLVARHREEIVHVNVDTDDILRDLDTPQDYHEMYMRSDRPGA
jgi:molybdenum cofactor cytidylyltransferase